MVLCLLASIQHCPNLTYYGMGHNLLAGTLPSELGLLSNLKEADFSGNSALRGPIPSELSALQELQHFDVSQTSITGGVPAELCTKEEQGSLSLVANCTLVDCCS